jgi:hypothetical protein
MTAQGHVFTIVTMGGRTVFGSFHPTRGEHFRRDPTMLRLSPPSASPEGQLKPRDAHRPPTCQAWSGILPHSPYRPSPGGTTRARHLPQDVLSLAGLS